MIDATRRILLKGSLAAGTVGVAIGAGLLSPRLVLAAAWPEAAFTAKDVQGALQGLFGGQAVEASDAITIKAPETADNGAVVEITVETTLPGAKSISIVASENPTPLVASFELGESVVPFVTTRIKMAKTADVIALVKTADKVYSAKKNVKVAVGGCGG
jgi:sulfur-oxidizing protein SoxY